MVGSHRYIATTVRINRGEQTVAAEILAGDVAYHGPASLSPGETTGIDVFVVENGRITEV